MQTVVQFMKTFDARLTEIESAQKKKANENLVLAIVWVTRLRSEALVAHHHIYKSWRWPLFLAGS